MFEINQRIRDEMKRQDLNNTQLAQLSGLSRSTVSRYVSDKIEPKQNAIGALAKALKVSPAWLLGFTDKNTEVYIELEKLTDTNRARLLAYYEALLDSQGG